MYILFIEYSAGIQDSNPKAAARLVTAHRNIRPHLAYRPMNPDFVWRMTTFDRIGVPSFTW